MSDYISRDVAIIEFMDNDIDHIQAPNGKEAVQILSDIPAADVISKADMITLLEETEREVLKGINRYSTHWIMIDSIFGIIKCKVNMMGEKTDDNK